MVFNLKLPKALYYELLGISGGDERKLKKLIIRILEDRIEKSSLTDLQNLVEKRENEIVKKLEFMEKLIASSEAMKDWKGPVKEIFNLLSKKLHIEVLFLIVKSDKFSYTAHVFWKYKPDSKSKEFLNEKIFDIIRTDLDTHHLSVRHSPLLNNKIVSFDFTRRLKFKKRLFRKIKKGNLISLGVGFKPAKLTKKELERISKVLDILGNIISSIKTISNYNKEVEYYATRDPLTNLYNQRVFWEFLKYEIDRAARHNYKVSLLVIDIDNFKLVNDTYGHIFGDLFIEKFAEFLKNFLTESSIVARFGGDEFCVILPEADTETAVLIAEQIKKNSEKVTIKTPDGKLISATVSIGIATFPDHAKDPKDLFIIADNMMYKAKKEGKDRIAYPKDEDLRALIEKKEKINSTLLYALKYKKIIPFFQPIYSLREKKVVAHEVLMRVEDESGNILPAFRFIEVAEEMGIIHKLELILFEKTFKTIRESNYSGRIFLNFSPKSISIPDYLENIKYMAKQFEIDPFNIVFEITERETTKNLEILKLFLNELKEFGFRFAIDDFGSGYSSFLYIKKLPIDFLKIEGDFIREIAYSKTDLAIVESIVVLAHSLGIETIAEFVENKDTLKKCEKLGVDYAQGFFIGKPSRILIHH